ncbi:uncharacterized protein ATNIH1004_004157 [Aspergillus tanneri]|nr:uncharacterized protein ATNIH1004_004157 [Aspergillus tanneri]KAA8648273.1 hypothetical protein ATNIH1004_004157 [Aspergillus tanneri]
MNDIFPASGPISSSEGVPQPDGTRFTVEGTPRAPYSEDLVDLLQVHCNMKRQ